MDSGSDSNENFENTLIERMTKTIFKVSPRFEKEAKACINAPKIVTKV